MAKDITFDERIDEAFDRYKDGDAPETPLVYDNLECDNCHHDHDGVCHCGCPRWIYWDDVLNVYLN